MYNKQDLIAALKLLPPALRRTIRDTASHLGVSTNVVVRLLKSGAMVRASLALHPTLTLENMFSRLMFAADEVMEVTANGEYFFKDMYDRVHVDEKWFFLVHDGATVYLAPDEDVPHLTIKSKLHIPKVMFLAANARPRYDPHTGHMWDGKIGMWPFAEQIPAARASKIVLEAHWSGKQPM